MAQDDKLVIEVGLDSSALSRGLEAVRRKSKQVWGDIGKSTLKYGRSLRQVEVIGAMSMRKLVKERQKVDAATGKSMDLLREEASQFRKVYDNYSKIIRDHRLEYKTASEARRKEIKKEIAADKARQKTLLADFKRSQGIADRVKGAKGSGGGGVGAAVGGMVKGLGGIMKSLGPILGTFSKMAPLITAVTGGLTGIVQLLIDAEAGAKEMNKNLLQAGGSGQFMSRNMMRGGAALVDMKRTLNDIRDQATDLSNISWGMNKEDHMAVLTTLQAEGVALKSLEQQYESAAGHAKSFGGSVQVAVAYSRQFGVSLQELSQFQAEMMTDLGSSLDGVEAQFSQMTRAAAESGIAQNKFFAMIRGISSDLSLYNSRLEDSVKILGRLGKVMSPRNAQKFLSTAMQGFKGKGRTDLLKMNLLAGGKGAEYNRRDIDRKAAGVASQIGGGVTAKDILDSNKTMAELLKTVPEEQQGTLREAITELRTDAKMNKKGLFGASMAMSNLSAGAALQMTQDALARFGGGKKKLSDMAGEIGPEMMAEQLGISREELASRIKMEAAFDDQREELKRGFAKQDPKTLELLQKAGIDGNKIDSAGYDQLMDTMDKSRQDELNASKEVIDYNKRTSEFTSTISDKIGALVDFVMNQIYNVMTSIWDVILDIADAIPGVGGGEERRKAKLEASVNKTRNKELMEIAAKSKNEAEFRDGVFKSQSFQNVMKDMSGLGESANLQKQYDDLVKKRDAAPLSEQGAIEKEIAAVDAKRKAAQSRQADLSAALDKQIGGTDGRGGSGKTARMQRLGQAAWGAFGQGSDPRKLGAARKAVDQGKSITAALEEAGYTTEEQTKMMQELTKTLSPAQLGQFLKETVSETAVTAAQSTPAPAAASSTSTAGVSPAGAPAPAAASAAPAASAAAAAAKAEPPVSQQTGDDTLSTLDSIQSILFQKGIKINQSFLRDKFWTNGHDAVLEATREALFEYFMYSGMDKNAVAQGMKDGKFNATDFGKKAAAQALATGKAPDIAGFASGGVIPQPKSPDSVFVAARPGETILPRGAGQGGGINIPITVNGPGGHELATMMQSAAIDVVQQWQRKQKYR